MCGADGADPTHCLDACSGYEAVIDEDDFAYRYYTVRAGRGAATHRLLASDLGGAFGGFPTMNNVDARCLGDN